MKRRRWLNFPFNDAQRHFVSGHLTDFAAEHTARAIEHGELDAQDNPLVNAPHTAAIVCAEEWRHPYTREQAAFPAPWVRNHKFWPPVGRIDNAYGDRNLVCTCAPLEELVA